MDSRTRSRTIPLSETTKFIVDNRGRTAPTVERGIPLIATNCISNGRLYPTYEKLRFVSQETYDTWFRSHPQPGDIILTNKGSQNGAICLVPEPVDFVIAQDMVALRADENVIDPLFLFAALRSPGVQQQIKNLNVSGVIPHFKKTDFDKLHLPYPERHIQEAVGRTYFDFCAKIELNRRMGQTLEAMAKALFKSWFLDATQDRLPNGWREVTVGDEVEIVKGVSYRSADLADSDTALVTLKSLKRGGGYRSDGLKPYTGEFEPDQIVSPGELVVAYTDVTQAAEVIGKPALVLADDRVKTLVASLDLSIVRPKASDLSQHFFYLLFLTPDFQTHIYGHTNGTTVLHLAKDGVPSYRFARPPEPLARAFTKTVQPLFAKISANEMQSRILAQLRDILLPKMLSGELRVPAHFVQAGVPAVEKLLEAPA